MKTAIVTGASRGIGHAIALQLAADGHRVVLTARDEKLLKDTAATIGADRSLVVALDLRLPDSAAKVVDTAMAKFGAIDIVVNNAGATKRGEFETLTDDDFIDGFALKYFGAVRMTRAAWPHLRSSPARSSTSSASAAALPARYFTIGGSVNAAHALLHQGPRRKGR